MKNIISGLVCYFPFFCSISWANWDVITKSKPQIESYSIQTTYTKNSRDSSILDSIKQESKSDSLRKKGPIFENKYEFMAFVSAVLPVPAFIFIAIFYTYSLIFLMPFVLLISFILGIKSIKKVKKKGLAIVGIAFGSIGILLILALTLLLYGVIYYSKNEKIPFFN